MADGLYIDAEERIKIVTKWVKITLTMLHVWASIILIAGLFLESDAELISNLFSTCTFGIGLTLGILLLDRAADAILSKFVTTPQGSIIKTVTTETVKSGAPIIPTPTTTVPGDATIKVEGDVNVEQPKP